MTQPVAPFAIAPCYFSWIDESGVENTLQFDLVESEAWDQGAEVTEHPVEQGANVADHVRVALPKVELAIFATNEPLAQGNNFTDMALGPLPLIAKEWQSNVALRGLITGAGGAIGAAAGGLAGNVVGELVGAAAASLIPPGQEVDTPVVFSTWQPLGEATDYVGATIQLLLTLKDTAQLITVNGTKQVEDNMVITGLTYTRSADEGTGASISITLEQLRIVQTQTVSVPLPAVPRATPPVNKGLQPPTSGSPAQQQSWLSGIAGWSGFGGAPTL